MSKKRLLITTDNFLPRWDGIARFLLEIIPRLKDDFDITVVSPNYGGSDLERLVKVVKMPLSNREFGDYRVAKVDKKRLYREISKADIIFNQSLGPIGVRSILRANKLKKKIICFTHSVEWELFPKAVSFALFRKILYPLTKLYARFLYNKCSLLVCPSESIADELTWHGIHVKKKIAHLGVDLAKFKKGNKYKIREKLNLPQNSFIVGYHGRLAREKNLFTLLRAFLRLEIKDKRLLLVGGGLRSIKDKLLKPKVIMTGPKDNVVPYLQAIDLYVMPSYTETTSLSVLEAMACELPVVSSKVGFVKQYIENGKNGVFFNKFDPYDLFKKVNHLHGNNILRESMGKRARKTVEELFNWDTSADKIKKALLSLK